jgi:hypothetical protein
MARNVAEVVFGPTTPPDLIDRLASSARWEELRFRGLMKAALLEFFACDSCAAPGAPTRVSATPALRSDAQLADLLADNCTDCHFDGATIPALEGDLDGDRVTRVLDQVLSGRMPPTGALPPPARLAFLDAAIREFPDGRDGWQAAGSILRASSDPAAALPMNVVHAFAQRVAGQTEPLPSLNLIENALDSRDNIFTPNYAIGTAVEAYQACGKDAKTRAGCTKTILDQIWQAQ